MFTKSTTQAARGGLTAACRALYQKCNIVTFRMTSMPAARPFNLFSLPAVALFGALATGTANAAPTKYPLTLENCRETITFNAAPKRVVAIGQTQTEILYALGLGDRVVGTAVWFSPVAKPYEAVNAKVKRLADNDPSFEAVLAQEPDLVTAMFEWHVGPNGIVGKRDQFAKVWHVRCAKRCAFVLGATRPVADLH